MEVWLIADEQPGNGDCACCSPQSRNGDAVLKPLDEFLEHEHGPGNRRIEGSRKTCPCPGSKKNTAIGQRSAEDAADPEGEGRSHLHARPFAAKDKATTDCQDTANEFDRGECIASRTYGAIEHCLDVRDAAACCMRCKPAHQPRSDKRQGRRHQHHEEKSGQGHSMSLADQQGPCTLRLLQYQAKHRCHKAGDGAR